MKTAKFSRFLPPRGLPNDSVKSTTVGTLTLSENLRGAEE